MAALPRPVTMMTDSTPEATASSTTYWIRGLSTSGNISFGEALVAGRKRVPNPAAGKTALRTCFAIVVAVSHTIVRWIETTADLLGNTSLSATVREGSVLATHEIEPSFTVGLVPRLWTER